MAAPACLLVHLKPTSATSLDGISVHNPDGSAFKGARLGAGSTLCFKEDPRPGTSTITGFQLGVESCGSCKTTSDSTPIALSLSFSPSIGNPDVLLLQATAAGKTYSASRNQHDIDGGKPIIRNTFDLTLLVAGLAVAVAVMGYIIWRFFFQPDPPPDGLRNRNRASGPA